MKKFFIILFITFACNDGENQSLIKLDKFKNQINLTHKRAIDVGELYRPFRIFIDNDLLFVYDIYQKSKCLFIYDLAYQKFLGKFITKGEGLGEISTIKSLNLIGDTLSLFDSQIQKVMKIHLPSLLTDPNYLSNDYVSLKKKEKSNEHFNYIYSKGQQSYIGSVIPVDIPVILTPVPGILTPLVKFSFQGF